MANVRNKRCTQASVERLDRSGTGRVMAGDLMAAIRQVGVALSPVQHGNMMDLLEKMGCILPGEEGECQWVATRAALDAIALAGEKATSGRISQDKVWAARAYSCKRVTSVDRPLGGQRAEAQSRCVCSGSARLALIGFRFSCFCTLVPLSPSTAVRAARRNIRRDRPDSIYSCLKL